MTTVFVAHVENKTVTGENLNTNIVGVFASYAEAERALKGFLFKTAKINVYNRLIEATGDESDLMAPILKIFTNIPNFKKKWANVTCQDDFVTAFIEDVYNLPQSIEELVSMNSDSVFTYNIKQDVLG
jgi:hypothetical protein